MNKPSRTKLSAVLFLASMAWVFSCSAPASNASSRAAPAASSSVDGGAVALKDGLYAIVAEGSPSDADAMRAKGLQVVIYENAFADGGEPREAPRVIALDTRAFVPLDLEGAPQESPDGNGRTLLSVTLRQEHVAALRDFTRAHVGGRVAIVLDGDIVTVHKLRAVIEDGRMQITRCSDDACRVLRSRLTR